MANPPPQAPMTVEAFEIWLATAQPDGRYELSAGQVVAMAPERAAHNRAKAAAFDALRAAAAQRPCEAFIDGMAVRIGPDTQREPDAALRCGPPLPPDATSYDDPVILVEVTSPATSVPDFSAKLLDYAQLPSLAHYLIVDLDRRAVIHHRKLPAGPFETRILTGGPLHLDPPDLIIDLDPILAAAPVSAGGGARR